MMQHEPVRTTKWPFVFFDLVLVGLGVFVVVTNPSLPLSRWELGAVVICFVVAAWVGVLPYLRDQTAAMRHAEQLNMRELGERLAGVEELVGRVERAAGGWRQVEESARGASVAAAGLVERLEEEGRRVGAAATVADEQQRQVLRLEVEKLRRGETELVQVLAHILDHTYALFTAATRSGQPQVAQQIGNFRAACLDAARRVGLLAMEARSGEVFDEKVHQLAEEGVVRAGARVQRTVACGYSYQGIGVRRILVQLEEAAEGAGEGLKQGGDEAGTSAVVDATGGS